jgi:hypothetical protein
MQLIPPLFMRLKIKGETGRGINLYLPLVIIWILLLPAVLIVLCLFLAAIPFLIWTAAGRRVLKITTMIPGLICAFRGMKIDIEDRKEIVKIDFQ